MHEMSIATAILDQAREEMERRQQKRLTRIGLRLGDLSGVDLNSLSFCFEVLVKDTDFEAVTLDVERTAKDDLAMTFLEFDDG